MLDKNGKEVSSNSYTFATKVTVDPNE